MLQQAAVLGKVFWTDALEKAFAIDAWVLEERLHALERKEFVRREHRSAVAGARQYVFVHALVRDGAYGQMPRAARAARTSGSPTGSTGFPLTAPRTEPRCSRTISSRPSSRPCRRARRLFPRIEGRACARRGGRPRVEARGGGRSALVLRACSFAGSGPLGRPVLPAQDRNDAPLRRTQRGPSSSRPRLRWPSPIRPRRQ